MGEDSLHFERKRTTFTKDFFDNEKQVNHIKVIIGLLIYVVIFVFLIPHILISNKLYYILAAYFPNLDMLATVLGYEGGPWNIWKYLYIWTTWNIWTRCNGWTR